MLYARQHEAFWSGKMGTEPGQNGWYNNNFVSWISGTLQDTQDSLSMMEESLIFLPVTLPLIKQQELRFNTVLEALATGFAELSASTFNLILLSLLHTRLIFI